MVKVLLILLAFALPVSTATSGLLPETEKALRQAERLYGSFIHVTSAYRTPEWNAQVGGVPGSYHISGEAVDVRMPENHIQLAKLVWAMSQAGFKGYGCYSTHLHFDTGKARYWRGK